MELMHKMMPAGVAGDLSLCLDDINRAFHLLELIICCTLPVDLKMKIEASSITKPPGPGQIRSTAFCTKYPVPFEDQETDQNQPKEYPQAEKDRPALRLRWTVLLWSEDSSFF